MDVRPVNLAYGVTMHVVNIAPTNVANPVAIGRIDIICHYFKPPPFFTALILTV